MGMVSDRRGFTLLEIMIVVMIIGLLAALAIPSFAKARTKAAATSCLNNQRVIWEALNVYAMENAVSLRSENWPNLCAARNCLSPGGGELYVKDWNVFECPVADTQDQHDYAYVWDNDEMVGIRCNNSSPLTRNLHGSSS